jgi:phosphoribosylglycinamide formyltransferase-1
MRILTDGFVRRYERRLVNIHPSLLPAYPGLHTHRRALEDGVKIHGCTVHFVTPLLDHGPIIVQAAVPVLHGDTEDALAARVLRQEHRVYRWRGRWFAEDRLVIENGIAR